MPTAATSDARPRPFTVVVCTRNRPQKLAHTLSALDGQQEQNFDLMVVDQSDDVNPALARRAEHDPSFTHLRDAGRGLSRARNLAVAAASSDWIVFVDDDCVLAPDWTLELAAAISRHPDADFVSGSVVGDRAHPEVMPIATVDVKRERRLSGPWPAAGSLGWGVCMALRRSTIERLGGWDERLGTGTPDFQGGEDVEFNRRLLRAGGVAVVTPRLRAVHEQWRSANELAVQLRGYMAADGGLAVKHLRTGDPVGAVRVWLASLRFILIMAGGGLTRRSRLRLRLASQQARGLVRGTAKGLTIRW